MMNYEEFKMEVADSIKDYLPLKYEDAEVSVNRVLKNNDTVLDGLLIRVEGSNISPSIYLNGFYEKYQQGDDFSSVMENIAQIRTEHERENMDLGGILDYEAVKDRITARLVNREHNEKLLTERPFTPVEDLAVTYHIVLENSGEGTASVPVSNEMMKQYGITLSELHETAMQNTFSEGNIKFMGMTRIMMEMMGGELPPEMPDVMNPEDEKMYVLTNNEKLNGAIAVMDKDTMSGIAEKVGGNFFVLPSSIHEVLVIPESQGMDYKELEAMVRDVNSTQVSPDERLSDHVYKFDAKTREFTRADRETNLENDKVNEFAGLSESHRDPEHVLKNMEKKEIGNENKPSIIGQIKKIQQEEKDKPSHKPGKEAVKSSKKEMAL